MSNFFQHNDKSFLFIHVPKTAGISICNALSLPVLGHHSVKHFRYLMQWWEYSFAIIRDPLTRLISCYNYLENGGVNKVDHENSIRYVKPYKDFKDFVKHGLNKAIENVEHFYPQSYFLTYNGKIDINYIGSFEKINESFDKICQRLKLPSIPQLQVTNYTKKVNWRDYYDNETIEIVKNLYIVDYNNFKKQMAWY